MRNLICIVLILGALFLLSQQSDFSAETPGETDTPEMLPAAPETLEEMRGDEWARIRDLGREAHYLIRPSEPKPAASVTFAQLEGGAPAPYGLTYQRLVQVKSAKELSDALKHAQPGDFIYLEAGVYKGNFVADVAGTAAAPIIVYGSRQAILEGKTLASGYGFHLMADYWTLAGFTLHNVSKGIVADRASHNRLIGLEIYQTGTEAVHFRGFSSDNRLEQSWIHDTGLSNAQFGEAVYIGSAVSNWERYSNGDPDASDRNQIIGNLLGPGITAESVDIKEGTTGGIVRQNTFISSEQMVANSWVDAKGNGYEIDNNAGMYTEGSAFEHDIDIIRVLDGWGQGNNVHDNSAYAVTGFQRDPLRAMFRRTNTTSIVLPERQLPYTLSEIIARYPASFEQPEPGTLLLKESIIVARGAHLSITDRDAHTIRLLSMNGHFVSISGYRGEIAITGSANQPVTIQSWDSSLNAPDTHIEDGRAYIFMSGGRMTLDYASFSDLGFGEGIFSGVAWKSYTQVKFKETTGGGVSNSRFERNYFGAYTFEALNMRWYHNTFAYNLHYGFDPHDFSNDFVFEENTAYGNGSHGIIFSRGCERNIIRNNISHDNQGHGIMLDDGRVVEDSTNPRYIAPVPSSHNIVEGNRVWNNQDGIVLEGGTDNVVRNNSVSGSLRYGVRFKDDVIASLVENNDIEGSVEYGIFIYNHSGSNTIVRNVITGGHAGIVIQNSTVNTIQANNLVHIDGAAVVLMGDVTGTTVTENGLAGTGEYAINAPGMDETVLNQFLSANNISGWKYLQMTPPVARYGALFMWLAIFLIPVIIRFSGISRWWYMPSYIPARAVLNRIDAARNRQFLDKLNQMRGTPEQKK